MSSRKRRPRPKPVSNAAKAKPGRVTPPKATGAEARPKRDPVADTGAGQRVVAASWWGTAVFSATALLAVVVRQLEAVAFVVSLVLFAAGCALFFVAYAKGVARSRTSQLAVTSLFLLAGSAPPRIRRHLLGSFAVQSVVAFAAAIARPYTVLAFGTLVPLYGLALCGVWAALHGTFPPRAEPERGRHR